MINTNQGVSIAYYSSSEALPYFMSGASAGPTPVTLSSVKAYQQGNDIAIEWKVQNETAIKHYEVEKSTDGITFTNVVTQTATGNNLSSVGLFIESSAPLAPGTELSVEFSLPDHPRGKYTAKGKVAWTRAKPERHLLFPGMGVQFTDINEKARKDLLEFVEALNRARGGLIHLTPCPAHSGAARTLVVRIYD